jgi:hypothetical protein
MLVLRASKAIAAAAMALLVSLVAFGNLTDYDTNFAFVQHVLLMDTIFPSATIHYRAIPNPALHHAVYALIIAAEVIRGPLLDRRVPAPAASQGHRAAIQSRQTDRHCRAHGWVRAVAGRIHRHWW